MAKNILAFFGMVFLTILVLVGVGMMGYLYDALGLVALPKDFSLAALYQPEEITVVAAENGLEKGVWSNPLEMLPVVSTTPMHTATSVPTFLPTETPIPPLDPLVYRAEITIRLKQFVAALELWLEVNEKLVLDNSLISDATWRNAMDLALVNVASTSRAMAGVGPAPAGYEAIDTLLDRVYTESVGLQQNYQQALVNGGASYFAAAGENFSRLKAYLTEAVEAMLTMGWTME
jgi:hypothetical protein